MLLSEIDWGQDSAENDPNLLQYFLESSAFRRLSRRQKQIVTGRKGSGKSALRKKLAKQFAAEPNTYALTISPTYTAVKSILNESDLQGAFGQEIFFQHTWMRQLLTDCLAAVGHEAKGTYATDSVAFAREVATQLNRTSKDLLENIVEVLRRVKAQVGDLGEFGLQLERELRNVADVDALEHHVLQLASDGARFVFLIDDLDQGWDNSQASNQMLLGLLRAATVLNGRSPNIFPIIFLREDVYTLLMPLTQHADKYRNVETIRWSRDQLSEVLATRIAFNRAQLRDPPITDAFHSVFPEMVGTSYSENWLIERTLSRPRELLQLARLYTESVDSSEPNAVALKQAEVAYSEWKLADLSSEFSNQYPGMSELFAAWKSRYPRGAYHLRREDLAELVDPLFDVTALNRPWFNEIAEARNVGRLTEILYEVGFLGDYIAGGAGGGARAHYSYMGPHQPRFDEVQIHPCFRRALDTVERRGRQGGAD